MDYARLKLGVHDPVFPYSELQGHLVLCESGIDPGIV